MALTKTALFTAATGAIVAGATTNTFTVATWDTPVAVGAEFSNPNDTLRLAHLKTDGETYEDLTIDQEEGDGLVILSKKRSQITIQTPGVYALSGTVVGATTGYTITV